MEFKPESFKMVIVDRGEIKDGEAGFQYVDAPEACELMLVFPKRLRENQAFKNAFVESKGSWPAEVHVATAHWSDEERRVHSECLYRLARASKLANVAFEAVANLLNAGIVDKQPLEEET